MHHLIVVSYQTQTIQRLRRRNFCGIHLYENICVTNKRWKRMQLPKIYHMVTIEVLSNYFVSFYSLYGNHSVIYMKGNNISQYTNKDSIYDGRIKTLALSYSIFYRHISEPSCVNRSSSKSRLLTSLISQVVNRTHVVYA